MFMKHTCSQLNNYKNYSSQIADMGKYRPTIVNGALQEFK